MPTDLTLVLETSTPNASLALASPDAVLEQRIFHSDRNHNSQLFAPLHALLSARKNPPIHLVLVGSGPGSYSGTRVGIAAAQGVAIALTCPALALPSILAVPTAHEGAPCLAIGDARRGSFWSSRMENFCLSTPPSLCDSQELITLVANAASEGIPVVSFDHPERFPLPHPLASLVTQEFPNAARLWHAWVHAPETARRTWRSHIPQPLYLKPPHITPAKRPNSLRP